MHICNRFKTHLRPVIRQDTRWNSTYTMVDRYFKLVDLVKDEEDMIDLIPSPAANRRLQKLHGELEGIESVSKALQSDDASLYDVRLYFDGLIAAKPSFAQYLGVCRSMNYS